MNRREFSKTAGTAGVTLALAGVPAIAARALDDQASAYDLRVKTKQGYRELPLQPAETFESRLLDLSLDLELENGHRAEPPHFEVSVAVYRWMRKGGMIDVANWNLDHVPHWRGHAISVPGTALECDAFLPVPYRW